MAFNHYAKIKRILEQQPQGWYVQRINKSTSAKSFKGEIRYFDHYYRIYSADGIAVPYCKFQQIDRFASVMGLSVDEVPIITD